MNLSQVLRVGSYSMVIAMLAQTSALAEPIDRYDSIATRQIALKNKINTELQANSITPADRKVLLKMMQKVNEHKTQLEAKHEEILTVEDKQTLDSELNEVSQKLYEAEDAKIAAKTTTKAGPAM